MAFIQADKIFSESDLYIRSDVLTSGIIMFTVKRKSFFMLISTVALGNEHEKVCYHGSVFTKNVLILS